MSRIAAELFFILLFFRFGVILSRPDTLVFSDCGPDDHVSNVTYLDPDFNNLFLYLKSDAKSSYGFANTSVYDNATAKVIYGLIMCYKDATSDDCSACLDFSTTNARVLCPLSNSAVFFYESCFLRYEYQHFISSLALDRKPQCVSSTSSVSDSINMGNTISGLLDAQRKNLDSHYLYAYDNKTDPVMNYSVSALVQCTRDLSLADCDLCLQFAIGNLSICSSNYTSAGARIQLMSCYASYKLHTRTLNVMNYQFIFPPPLPDMWSPSPQFFFPPPPPDMWSPSPTDMLTPDSGSSGSPKAVTWGVSAFSLFYTVAFISSIIYACNKRQIKPGTVVPGISVETPR